MLDIQPDEDEKNNITATKKTKIHVIKIQASHFFVCLKVFIYPVLEAAIVCR